MTIWPEWTISWALAGGDGGGHVPHHPPQPHFWDAVDALGPLVCNTSCCDPHWTKLSQCSVFSDCNVDINKYELNYCNTNVKNYVYSQPGHSTLVLLLMLDDFIVAHLMWSVTHTLILQPNY